VVVAAAAQAESSSRGRRRREVIAVIPSHSYASAGLRLRPGKRKLRDEICKWSLSRVWTGVMAAGEKNREDEDEILLLTKARHCSKAATAGARQMADWKTIRGQERRE
jgi:hypothetical protein